MFAGEKKKEYPTVPRRPMKITAKARSKKAKLSLQKRAVLRWRWYFTANSCTEAHRSIWHDTVDMQRQCPRQQKFNKCQHLALHRFAFLALLLMTDSPFG